MTEDVNEGVKVKLGIQGSLEGGEHLAHVPEGVTCQDERNDEGGPVEFLQLSQGRSTLIFYVAGILFLLNFALGLLVQLGVVDTKPFRWLHHALFFAVFVSAAAAALVGFLWGAPYRWALLPILILFAILPYVRAGTPGHAALACGTLVFYVAGFLQTVQVL